MQSFIEFIEKYPELYKIAKSDFIINLLKEINKKALSKTSIKRMPGFLKLSEYEIDLILKYLEKTGLIEKNKFSGKTIYYKGNKLNLFLENYNKTAKEFKIVN